MIEQGLFEYLSANAGVSALVDSRIYPSVMKQGVDMPVVVFSRIGSQRSRTFCATDSLVLGTFQLDCYDRGYLKAVQLAAAVRSALVDYAGLMGDTTVNQVSLESEFDTDDPEPGLYRVSQTYSIWYLED